MKSLDKLYADLKRLKKIDSKYSVFGSDHHRYKMNPILSESQVSDFEQTHGIVLPEDYRMFVLHIGNGGAGPSFGIPPLDGFFSVRDYVDIDIPSNFLSTQFPFSRERSYVYTDESDESLIREMTGTFTLCHHGCGHYDMLILSGKEKGSVWFDSRCSDEGMGLRFEHFLDWYFDWLDKSIRSFVSR